MTDEAFVVPHVLCSFSVREIDLINIHGIGIPCWSGGSGSLGWWDEAISPTPELPESYHIPVELSCFIKPLFPFPTSLLLFFREGSGSHHDSKLVGYPLLKGIYQDTIEVNSTACLSQPEGDGILVKVPIELVHAYGVNSLAGSVLDILQDEGFFKGIA